MGPRNFRIAVALLVGAILLPFHLLSQTSTITGIINIYTPVLSYGPCANFVTVGSSAGFAVGDTVLLIQMQGAIIDQTNTAAYGTISNYNGAGLFEKAEIQGISGNSVYFTQNLINTYDFAGKVQMISIPVYQNATVSGVLTGQAWDGSTGGVVVLEARGTLNVLVGNEINMNSKGFKPGLMNETCPNSCNFSQNNADYFYADPNYRGSLKGEGIAAITAGFQRGRGAQANGGGGGNDHNSGGAGGGNLTAGGMGSRNNEPGAFLCKGYNPGEAGKALNPLAGARIFMGGGGGAGHGNNFAVAGTGCTGGGGSTAGTAGGGIIIVIANSLNASGVAFKANAVFAGSGNGDGAGGGGAGGSVLLDVAGVTASAFTIEAKGGNGGSTFGFGQNRCYGPGGGGAGGAVFYKGAGLPGTITTTLTGGVPGTILSTSNACLNTSGTATAGAAGLVLASAPGVSIGSSVAVVPCILPVEYGYFTANPSVQNSVRLDWSTTSEVSNDRFEIEHSTDAFRFDVVGTVASASQDHEGATYGFVHRQPAVGTNWYRLRQYDLDGHSAVSEIRQVHFEPNAISIIQLYPNPVDAPNEAILEVMLPGVADGMLSVMNIMGQQVSQVPVALQSGSNAIHIPTQSLGSGIYFLRLQAGKHGELVTKLKVR
jgi:hypothetical protein